MTRRTGTIITLAVLAVALLAGAGVMVWHARTGPGVRAAGEPAVGAARVDAPEDARAPAGVRIRVRVLNATRTRGLARRATQMLRDRGFDVVETGTTAEQRDSSAVLDHVGNAEYAARLARAMGGAAVIARPDTSRYLDATVLIGRRWTPPAEPFYP